MIRYPSGPDTLGERLQVAQVIEVQWIGRADRQRHPVHDDRIPFAYAIDHVERAAAADHEVLGDDLEPVERRPVLQHVGVMLTPKPDAAAEPRKRCRWRCHAAGVVGIVYSSRVEAPGARALRRLPVALLTL